MATTLSTLLVLYLEGSGNVSSKRRPTINMFTCHHYHGQILWSLNPVWNVADDISFDQLPLYIEGLRERFPDCRISGHAGYLTITAHFRYH
jgi:hypothetical protein